MNRHALFVTGADAFSCVLLFFFSETSSVCSSSDTGLFTNDEGRQGNLDPSLGTLAQCFWEDSHGSGSNFLRIRWLSDSGSHTLTGHKSHLSKC